MSDFSSLVRQYVRSDPDDRDPAKGAMLILRITGDSLRYRALMRNPARHADKIIEDLKEYLRSRDAVPTPHEARQIRAEAAAIVAGNKDEVKEWKGGKRTDHDSLPEHIRLIFEQNMSLKRRISQYHLEIRNLLKSTKDCASADIKALVALLKKADIEYRSNWKKYDGYKGQDSPQTTGPIPESDSADQPAPAR